MLTTATLEQGKEVTEYLLNRKVFARVTRYVDTCQSNEVFYPHVISANVFGVSPHQIAHAHFMVDVRMGERLTIDVLHANPFYDSPVCESQIIGQVFPQ